MPVGSGTVANDERAGTRTRTGPRVAEVSSPDVVVGVVDQQAAVAVGAAVLRRRLAQRASPDDVILRIDHVVAVVVARQPDDAFERERERTVFWAPGKIFVGQVQRVRGQKTAHARQIERRRKRLAGTRRQSA